jgi:hypothetical protein
VSRQGKAEPGRNRFPPQPPTRNRSAHSSLGPSSSATTVPVIPIWLPSINRGFLDAAFSCQHSTNPLFLYVLADNWWLIALIQNKPFLDGHLSL